MDANETRKPSGELSELQELAVEWTLTVLALVALWPVLADLWGQQFSEIAARIEHGLALGLVVPVETIRTLGWFDLRATGAEALLPPLGCALLGAAILTATAWGLDPPPGTKPSAKQRILALPWTLLLGPPALFAGLAASLIGAGLYPLFYGGFLACGGLGGLLGRRRRRVLLPYERSLTGLPPASWPSDHGFRFALFFAGLGAILAALLLGARPLESGVLPAAEIVESQSWMGPYGLSCASALAILTLLLVAPPTRRAFGLLSWEPAFAGVLGGALLSTWIGLDDNGAVPGAALGVVAGVTGAALGSAGIPVFPRLSPHPLRALGRLSLPLAASLATLAYTVDTGFLGCEAVLADERITLLSTEVGISSLAYDDSVTPALFAAHRTKGAILRLALDEKPNRALVRQGMRLGELGGAPVRRVRPVALGQGVNETLFAVVELEREGDVPGSTPNTAVLALDAYTAKAASVAEDPVPCRPSRWQWHPLLSIGLVACRDSGDILLYEASMGAFIARARSDSRPQVEDLVIDPLDGSMLSLARRKSPFVVRMDLQGRELLSYRFLGMGNRRLILDSEGLLHIPRFLARQVLSLDGPSLTPIEARPAGFGLAAIEVLPEYDRVAAASPIDGYLYAVEPLGESPTVRIRLGGLVESLSRSRDGRTLFAAGRCGVMAVDVESWLGGD